jgi:hypothetical protein
MILILRKTFESYPTSFKGSSVGTMRTILSKPKSIRTVVLAVLKTVLASPAHATLKSGLVTARARFQALPPPAVLPAQLIPNAVVPDKADPIIQHFDPCISARPFWTSNKPPKYSQVESPLRKGIVAPESKRLVFPLTSERVVPVAPSSAEIGRRLGIKTKKPVFEVSPNWRTNLAIASRLADVFQMPNPTRDVDPTMGADTLRDVSQGLLQEVLATIGKTATNQERLVKLKNRDITLMMLLADVERARTDTNTLRATERLYLVNMMKNKSDSDREITKELLDKGLVPDLIGIKERILFAQEMSERVEREMADAGDEEIDPEVALVRPLENEEGEPIDGDGENGEQADRLGDEAEDQPHFGDNDENGI